MSRYEEFVIDNLDLDEDVAGEARLESDPWSDDVIGPVEMKVILESEEYGDLDLRVAGCVRDWGTLCDLYGADAAPDFGEYMEVVGF
jgi:uncharacterized protein YjfI (DUF2170 family)